MARQAGAAAVAEKVTAKTKAVGTVRKPARNTMVQGGARTSPMTRHPVPVTLQAIEARMVGDQLRGIAYLAKKLALAIREKELATPFHPDEVKEVSDKAYALADRLRLLGDNGSNGG